MAITITSPGGKAEVTGPRWFVETTSTADTLVVGANTQTATASSRNYSVGVDTTKEKKKRYRKLAESYGFRPVIDCNYDIMRFDDGTLDFEITLNTTNDGTPFGALPLAVYSVDKRQLVSARREEMEFETLSKLNQDQRMMWRYVMRRMREKKTSETIVFDTIFKNLEQPELVHPAQNRQKRSRMLTTLHKMLEERQSQGILTFIWNRNKNGQFEYSVTIKLTKNDDENGEQLSLEPSKKAI